MENLKNANITFCIILNNEKKYDVDRFYKVTHPYLIKNTPKDSPINLIVKNKKLNNFPTEGISKIIEDSEIIKELKTNRPYKRMHLIKMYSYKTIDTDYYIVIDSDTFLTKPFKIENIVDKDYKISLNIHNGVRYLENDTGKHKEWIINSEKTIGTKLDRKFLHFSVSPFFVITEQMKNMVEFLQNNYEDFCETFLKNDMGMESSLYYAYLNKIGVLYEYSTSSKNYINDIDAIWSKSKKEISELDKSKQFWVIQSNTEIPNIDIYFEVNSALL